MSFHQMTNDEIRRHAPAAFATSPAPWASTRYNFISTERVIDGMREVGLFPVSARQQRANSARPIQYQRHTVAFAPLANQTYRNRARSVGDVFPQINLTNGHDTLTTFDVSAGLFRLVCLNGMAVPYVESLDVDVKHINLDVDTLLETVLQVVEGIPSLFDRVDAYNAKQISVEEQLRFASQVLEFKPTSLPLQPVQVLAPRRSEDRSSMSWTLPKRDLWTTLNVIQENLMRGGIQTRNAIGRRATTRAIRDISQDHEFNKRLFALADQFLAS